MRLFDQDIWWKGVIVILSLLLSVQLLFSRHVHQITIFTYRIMQDYYRNNKMLNASRYFFFDSNLYINENSSIYNMNDWSKFWELTSKMQETMEQCVANLTHVFVPDNNSLMYVTPGGMWTPQYCRPWTRVALIIPYRWREPHLKKFVPYMHSFLQSQSFAYQIFVVEQYSNDTFNRAKLMNVGFLEAKNISNFDCYIFHDVDLLPLDSYILYNCSASGPIHMASAIDKWGFKMPYYEYFGGVCGFTEVQLQKINGFSNRFFGWGGEDDEIGMRVGYSGQMVQRFPVNVGRYHMFRHGKDDGNDANPRRIKLLDESVAAWRDDGLNSLKYKLVERKTHMYYTKISVDISDKKTSTTSTITTTTTTTSSVSRKLLLNKKSSTYSDTPATQNKTNTTAVT